MARDLNDLSTEELGKLFPIILSDYNPDWPKLYAEEETTIKTVIGEEKIIKIQHIGSTSVPGLIAKPTIDILLEIDKSTDLIIFTESLLQNGYNLIHKPENPAPHMMFVKGYSQVGFNGQAYHIHVRYPGDWDEPYFRNYLIENRDTAEKYAELKKSLIKIHELDREAYTDNKTEFVKKYTKLARKNK